MTEADRQIDIRDLRKLECIMAYCPDSLKKDAMSDLIRASRLLLQQPPNIDEALTAIGMASGFLATDMGI